MSPINKSPEKKFKLIGVPDHRDDVKRAASRIDPTLLHEKFIPKPYMMYGSRRPSNQPYDKQSREGELRSNYLGFLKVHVYGKTNVRSQAKWLKPMQFVEELPSMVDFCDTI